MVGMLSKILFLLAYNSLMPALDIKDCLNILWHGLRLDIAISGYLSIIPGLLLAVSVWCNGKLLRIIWNTYFGITAFLSSVAYISNLGLYKFWGFPLDSTPLLYISTSPTTALASIPVWQSLMFAIMIIAVATSIYLIFAKLDSGCHQALHTLYHL